jgi:hypothetical protein
VRERERWEGVRERGERGERGGERKREKERGKETSNT